jgi:hypothetical protein
MPASRQATLRIHKSLQMFMRQAQVKRGDFAFCFDEIKAKRKISSLNLSLSHKHEEWLWYNGRHDDEQNTIPGSAWFAPPGTLPGSYMKR